MVFFSGIQIHVGFPSLLCLSASLQTFLLFFNICFILFTFNLKKYSVTDHSVVSTFCCGSYNFVFISKIVLFPVFSWILHTLLFSRSFSYEFSHFCFMFFHNCCCFLKECFLKSSLGNVNVKIFICFKTKIFDEFSLVIEKFSYSFSSFACMEPDQIYFMLCILNQMDFPELVIGDYFRVDLIRKGLSRFHYSRLLSSAAWVRYWKYSPSFWVPRLLSAFDLTRRGAHFTRCSASHIKIFSLPCFHCLSSSVLFIQEAALQVSF